MAKKTKQSWFDRFCKAISTQDSEELEKLVGEKTDDEDPDEDDKGDKAKTGDRAVLDSILKEMKSISKRVGDMEAALEEAKKTDDEDPDDKDKDKDKDKGKTDDTLIDAEGAGKADTGNTYTGDAYRSMVSRAEILVPGFSIPTTDSVKTVDAAAKLQRRVLDQALANEATAQIIKPVLAGRALDKMTADTLDAVFAASAELVRLNNNGSAANGGNGKQTTTRTTADFGRAVSPADLNRAAQDFWAGRK